MIRARSTRPVSHIESFPEGLRPYIRHIKDAAADGNCGFRAIAGLVGLTEDGWAQVMIDILDKLVAHEDQYKQLYGAESRVQELIKTLLYLEDHPPISIG